MAFGFAGAAQGASRALEEIVAQRLLEQKLEAEIADRQSRMQMDRDRMQLDRDRLGESMRASKVDEGQRQQTIDLSDRTRRDRNNEQGIDLMDRDRARMDEEQILGGLNPKMQTLAKLRKVGVSGVSPEDLDTPEERAARDQQAIDRAGKISEAQARGAARYRAPREGRKSIQQVVGPDNTVQLVSVDLDTGESTPIQLPPGTAPNKPAKPITGAERAAVGFFNRMLEAERNARKVEDKLTNVDLGSADFAPDFLENWLKSPEGQSYAQAQRTFTEGRLRKESGAAVPPAEYESDRRTNFRVSGDKPDSVKQKRGSRVQTMKGIANTAGRALQEFYGDDATIDSLLSEFADQGSAPIQKEIPGIPGGIAEFRDGKWIRVK